LSSTAVFMGEVVKVLCCIATISYIDGFKPRDIWNDSFGNTMDALKIAVPAGVYALQNNLLYLGLSNLEAPIYQVSNQLKILTTAVFFVVLLKQHLSLRKWIALVLLFAGIALVQVQSIGMQPSLKKGENVLVGLIAVLTASITSGFAGVYFEKLLKASTVSLWVRNIQLGSFGALFALVMCLTSDYELIVEYGFWYGWNWLVWLVVLVSAVGGLIIALVVLYADNILKGFASALSIILSSIFSVYLFDFGLSWLFGVGTLLVVVAIYLYQLPDHIPDEGKESDVEIAPVK